MATVRSTAHLLAVAAVLGAYIELVYMCVPSKGSVRR